MAATKRRTEKPKKESPRPLRVSIREAARMCSVSYGTIHSEVQAQVFTVIAASGRGRGKRVYIPTDEVDAYAFGGPDAVKSLRYKLGRLK